MPFINVKTNTVVSPEQADKLKSLLGNAITAIPGKSEAWLMVGIEDKYQLWFKGDAAPAAMVDVSLLGSASEAALSDMTARVTDALTGTLGLPADRIYICYQSTSFWGWNGSNF